MALHSHDDKTTVISNPLRLRVAPPRSYEEEFLAQDFFSESVGRILAFDGSRVLSSGNDTLQQVVEQLNDRPNFSRDVEKGRWFANVIREPSPQRDQSLA